MARPCEHPNLKKRRKEEDANLQVHVLKVTRLGTGP
eukprot:SAG31_NODE_23822_length_494_cov_9.481013_2_plen_36_part_00